MKFSAMISILALTLAASIGHSQSQINPSSTGSSLSGAGTDMGSATSTTNGNSIGSSTNGLESSTTNSIPANDYAHTSTTGTAQVVQPGVQPGTAVNGAYGNGMPSPAVSGFNGSTGSGMGTNSGYSTGNVNPGVGTSQGLSYGTSGNTINGGTVNGSSTSGVNGTGTATAPAANDANSFMR